MTEWILIFSIATNLAMLGGFVFVFTRSKKKPSVEVQYFEFAEDIDGAMSTSKKVTIKGQVMVDGIPIGGQFVVAEKSFKKFDYDKLNQFKREVLDPFARGGFQVAQTVTGLQNVLGSARNISKIRALFRKT